MATCFRSFVLTNISINQYINQTINQSIRHSQYSYYLVCTLFLYVNFSTSLEQEDLTKFRHLCVSLQRTSIVVYKHITQPIIAREV
jgi:hypothetical protein